MQMIFFVGKTLFFGRFSTGFYGNLPLSMPRTFRVISLSYHQVAAVFPNIHACMVAVAVTPSVPLWA
jgi:hypothetical protein